MAGKYTSQKDLAELALYRRLAEINGRLDALKAMEAIEDDIRRNKRFDLRPDLDHASRGIEIHSVSFPDC
jgi:hypothetical protein